MSELKPVEEMTQLEVNNETMERRHDCGLNYNIGRWALKWLRLEQDAAFGPFDGEPVEVEESSKEAERRARPGLDWGELVELLGDLRSTADAAYPYFVIENKDATLREMALAHEWIDRLTAAFGPFEDEPIELKESDRKGAYVSDDLYGMVCDLNSWCRYCFEFFSDRSEKNSKNIRDAINRSTDWITNQPQFKERMKEGLFKAQERLLTRKPSVDVDTGKVWLKESEPEEKDALHYTLKDDEFTLYRADEVELKIVGISSAKTVQLEQPTPLDIDTPTLKRCGSRFLVQWYSVSRDGVEPQGTECIELLDGDDIVIGGPDRGVVNLTHSRERCRSWRYQSFEQFETKSFYVSEQDARIIQNAWLEMGR